MSKSGIRPSLRSPPVIGPSGFCLVIITETLHSNSQYGKGRHCAPGAESISRTQWRYWRA
eukprot:scaffold1077_cov388-Prasinococcus_capsulatus_cf.AAC.9